MEIYAASPQIRDEPKFSNTCLNTVLRQWCQTALQLQHLDHLSFNAYILSPMMFTIPDKMASEVEKLSHYPADVPETLRNSVISM